MIRLLAVLAVAAVVLLPSQPKLSGWLTFGNDPGRSGAAGRKASGSPRARWSIQLPAGRITSQPIVVRGVFGGTRATVYVATSAGQVYALSDGGRILWRAFVGRLSHQCPQLDGYGVTGTPVVDPATRSLYAADALGKLHALDLATGKERAGWPVRIFSDFRDELVWGALLAVRGSIYVPTGSFCDEPMIGKVIRVEERTRRVSRWISVPASSGGGGGIWGWGGVAYSARRGSLLAVTGNAFRGGSNDGDRFREWAPYGEHLVELSRRLKLRAANHPADVNEVQDLDFAGSPVIVSRPGCGELAVALNKNGRLYAWRTAKIAAGPSWSVRLIPDDPRHPLISQPTYSRALHAIFVSTQRGLVKVAVTRKCRGRIAWRHRLGAVNGTATIAGTTVWLVPWHTHGALLGIDGRTGRTRTQLGLGPDRYLVGPAVLDGRLYLGSYGGIVRALW
jgi:outer membrane protein assembly factor BamB